MLTLAPLLFTTCALPQSADGALPEALQTALVSAQLLERDVLLVLDAPDDDEGGCSCYGDHLEIAGEDARITDEFVVLHYVSPWQNEGDLAYAKEHAAMVELYDPAVRAYPVTLALTSGGEPYAELPHFSCIETPDFIGAMLHRIELGRSQWDKLAELKQTLAGAEGDARLAGLDAALEWNATAEIENLAIGRGAVQGWIEEAAALEGETNADRRLEAELSLSSLNGLPLVEVERFLEADPNNERRFWTRALGRELSILERFEGGPGSPEFSAFVGRAERALALEHGLPDAPAFRVFSAASLIAVRALEEPDAALAKRFAKAALAADPATVRQGRQMGELAYEMAQSGLRELAGEAEDS